MAARAPHRGMTPPPGRARPIHRVDRVAMIGIAERHGDEDKPAGHQQLQAMVGQPRPRRRGFVAGGTAVFDRKLHDLADIGRAAGEVEQRRQPLGRECIQCAAGASASASNIAVSRALSKRATMPQAHIARKARHARPHGRRRSQVKPPSGGQLFTRACCSVRRRPAFQLDSSCTA